MRRQCLSKGNKRVQIQRRWVMTLVWIDAQQVVKGRLREALAPMRASAHWSRLPGFRRDIWSHGWPGSRLGLGPRSPTAPGHPSVNCAYKNPGGVPPLTQGRRDAPRAAASQPAALQRHAPQLSFSIPPHMCAASPPTQPWNGLMTRQAP